jgi:hypothetical protein
MAALSFRLGLACWLGFSISSVAAAEKTASQLLPPSVVAYVEIPQPAKLIDSVLDHPLAKEIEAHPEYQKYLQSPWYQHLQEVDKAVQEKLGMNLRTAATTMAAEGIYFGGDLPTQGVVLLVRSADENCTEKARDTFLELARAETKRQGKDDPIKVEELGDTTAYQLGEARFATQGPWLIVSNKPLLLSAVLSNYSSEDPSCLDKDSQFRKVYASRDQQSQQATLWSYLDFRLLRAAGLLKQLANRKSDNPVAELLAGGIIAAVPDAAYATGTLNLEGHKVGLTLSMPANVAAAAKRREFYFSPEGDGNAPPLLQPKQAILSVSTYRDFGSLWRNAPDLFDDKVNAGFAQAETGLSTFFSGRNFRDEILGNLQPGMQLVIARQEYGDVVPALKLPAGAIVVRMKNPEETARIFKITFQSAIGFLNVAGGMNGVDPLDCNAERSDGMVVVTAEYLPPKDEALRKAAPPQFNASPTAIFFGDKFILASSKSLAMEVLESVRKEPAVVKEVNTALQADVDVLHQILADNTESLVTQNLLQKGHDRAAAEKDIKGLLDAIGHLKSTSLKLLADEKSLTLSWDVELK